jgi:hypothetical protein
MLHDPVMLARCVEQQTPFAKYVGGGLLHIHILAGQHRGDRNRRMPVMRCGDEYNIDRLIVEYSAKIRNHRRLLPTRFFDLFDCLAHAILVRVAHGRNHRVCLLEQRLEESAASATGTNNCHGDRVVRRSGAS